MILSRKQRRRAFARADTPTRRRARRRADTPTRMRRCGGLGLEVPSGPEALS